MSKTANKKIGFFAGLILRIFGKEPKADIEEIRKADFSADTAKIGVSFTDRIRNFFRSSWIKKH